MLVMCIAIVLLVGLGLFIRFFLRLLLLLLQRATTCQSGGGCNSSWIVPHDVV